MSAPTCCTRDCREGRYCPLRIEQAQRNANRMTSLHPLRTICCGAAFCYLMVAVAKALIG